MTVKIFGREPAALIGALQGVLALLVGFGALEPIGLSTQTDLAVVVGVLTAASAVYLALVTNETLLAPAVELAKAALALGAIYGLAITAEQTSLVIAALTAVLAAWHRGQVIPVANPSLRVDSPSYIAR